ncbi:hypothetical protein KL86DES1_20809 [uncultured Desulfovibrio sp.]|uniref:Uncharacterized protein n=1 Tax=uncultured Desulfovibrio sp. TaxID=167968 RepID=A0A212L5E2_9BACT|nr:hypothetical protein KL86DES1_20809 [uncultured Desulfovibrio sp.]VZH33710.1 conserved protein of unknown function [Desulfovibrio sp. 86]
MYSLACLAAALTFSVTSVKCWLLVVREPRIADQRRHGRSIHGMGMVGNGGCEQRTRIALPPFRRNWPATWRPTTRRPEPAQRVCAKIK